MNNDNKRVASKILAEKTKSNQKNTMIWKWSENKKCGEHEQIQMEKAGERKTRKVNTRKNKAWNDK